MASYRRDTMATESNLESDDVVWTRASGTALGINHDEEGFQLVSLYERADGEWEKKVEVSKEVAIGWNSLLSEVYGDNGN